MNHYTLDEVMSWNPCYRRERVKELFAGRETITLLDVLDMEIPDWDKLWVAEEMERELYHEGLESADYLLPWLREQLEREDPVLERLEKVEKNVNHLDATLTDFIENHHLYQHEEPEPKPPEKPETCGTCRHLHKPKDYDRWNNLPYYAFCWVKYDGVYEAWWESNEAETWEACPKFEEAIK